MDTRKDALRIGSRVIVVGGRQDYRGRAGTVTGCTGSIGPLHWFVLFADGWTGLFRSDELTLCWYA